MQFSELLQSMAECDGTWTTEVPDTWLQGRTVFGGLQAALMLRAMRATLPEPAPLRVLQSTFVGPVPSGKVRARARVLRVGRSATQVEARLLNGTDTAAVAVAVFGKSRESRVRVVPEEPPIVASDAPLDIRYVPGLSPSFLQHATMRLLRGGFLYSATTDTKASMEVGLLGEGPTGEEHVIAIADIVWPIALSFLSEPTMGSTMTWMVEMLSPNVAELPLAGFRADVELVAAHDGYTSQSVMLWGPRGEPVALSRQSMVVFG